MKPPGSIFPSSVFINMENSNLFFQEKIRLLAAHDSSMHVAAALIVLYWNGTLPVKPHTAATKASHYHDSVPLPSKTCMLMLFFPPAACKPSSTALPFPVGMLCQAVRVTFLFSALFRVRLHKFQHKQFALCLSHLCFLCCCFVVVVFSCS